MSATHTRTFRVRYYECDAYGHLNNTNYVRYMQEAAFDASAAVGYDLQRYEAMQRLWLVRHTDIEYLQPLYYNEQVEVKTWVADFRRATSRRMYEFRRAGQAELAARAHSDWVFMDTESRRPASIPAEMAAAFLPQGQLQAPLRRAASLPVPPHPPGAFHSHVRVAWQDIDTAFLVNNPVYLNYAGECGFQAVAALGWPAQRMLDEGFAILVRRNQIEYLQPARLGEELRVSTWLSNVRRSTAWRHYEISRPADQTLLARLQALIVWVDRQTGQPVRIPAGLLADFATHIAPAFASE